MTIGSKAPVDATDEFARKIAGLEQRIADLERGATRYTTSATDILTRARTFYVSYDNFTSGSAYFDTHDNIFVAPYPLVQIVQVSGYVGFNGAANQVWLSVWCNGGGTEQTGSRVYVDLAPTSGLWHAFACMGAQAFTAGQSVGYRLGAGVTTSNAYIRANTSVTYFRTG